MKMNESWAGAFCVKIERLRRCYYVAQYVNHYPKPWQTSQPAKGRLDYVICTSAKTARAVAVEMVRQAAEYRGDYAGMHGSHAFAEKLESRQGCEDVGLKHFHRVQQEVTND